MLKQLLFTVFLFCMCSAVSASSADASAVTGVSGSLKAASDTSVATFTSRKSLVLDTTSAPVHFYMASISALGFSGAEEARAFFNSITDNLLSYEFNLSTGVVVINIHLQYANAEWTITDWNKYINSKLNP